MGDHLTLYFAARAEQEKIWTCADEDGVIDTERMEEITENFEERVEAVIAVIKTMKAEREGHIKTLDLVAENYSKRILALGKSEERLKGYLYKCMQLAGREAIKSMDGLHAAKIYKDRDCRVVIEQDAKLSDEYLLPQKARDPDKKALKAAIESGAQIAGVRLEKNDRLEIK